MRQVNIHEAKTHFSELIAAVERGEEIVIARRGKPVAKIGRAAAGEAKRQRVFGQWAGQISADPSFFEPATDEELAEGSKHRPAYDDVNAIVRSRQVG